MRTIHVGILSTLLLTLAPASAIAAEKPRARPSPLVLDPASLPAVPANAVPGSTPERIAALRGIAPASRQKYVRQAQRLARSPHLAARPVAGPRTTPHVVQRDLFGNAVRGVAPRLDTAAAAPAFTTRPAPHRKTASMTARRGIAYSGPDDDGDALPDDFEAALGDGFTPLYGVSGGEDGGTGFARFADSAQLSIVQNLPAVPPTSHYRVTPVGFAYDANGQQYGFLQIDYLTLWNRDDGLDIGGDCRFYASVLGGLTGYALTQAIDEAEAHPFDQERSAALVAAPTSAPFQYASDPDAYQAYDFYTAAHEGTFFDHSGYLGLTQAVPINNHLNLALSRSKHGTYTFDPDHLPLFPGWVIGGTYATLDTLYYYGEIDDYQYLTYLGMADATFYACIVERFDNQGGAYADPRINVGELGHTLNGSGFIYHPDVQGKLSPLLWVVQ